MFSVELSPAAEKHYTWLFKRDRKLFERVRNVLLSLEVDPLQGKPLQGELHGFRSFRVGIYRIVYEIQNEKKKIVVMDIGHRKDIYR